MNTVGPSFTLVDPVIHYNADFDTAATILTFEHRWCGGTWQRLAEQSLAMDNDDYPDWPSSSYPIINSKLNARKGYFLSAARAAASSSVKASTATNGCTRRRDTGLSAACLARPNCRASERHRVAE